MTKAAWSVSLQLTEGGGGGGWGSHQGNKKKHAENNVVSKKKSSIKHAGEKNQAEGNKKTNHILQ